MVGAHYPERSYKIFILNAPWWFSVVWKVRCFVCAMYDAVLAFFGRGDAGGTVHGQEDGC